MDKNNLTEKLARVQWLSVRYHLHNMREHGPMADATRGQGRVLAMLKAKPEISTRELSYILGIRPQSLTELLGKLEKGGYIVREQSEEDRRVIIVKLTEKGRDDGLQKSVKNELFDCLTDEEASNFEICIDKLIDKMTQTLAEEGTNTYAQWFRDFRETPHGAPGHGGFNMHGPMSPHMRHGFGGGFEKPDKHEGKHGKRTE